MYFYNESCVVAVVGSSSIVYSSSNRVVTSQEAIEYAQEQIKGFNWQRSDIFPLDLDLAVADTR